MKPEQQLAKFIRQVMNNATVPSNDQFQQNLATAKRWLEAIAAGDLVVVAPIPVRQPEPLEAAPVEATP